MAFTANLNYYGIAEVTGSFTGNLHRDFVLFSVCEIPTAWITIVILDKMGRKPATLLGYAVTSFAFFIFGMLQVMDVQWIALRLFLGILAKIFNVIAWSGLFVWNGELYPTTVRSQVVGLFAYMSNFGSFCAPWISNGLKQHSVSLPYFVFAAFPLLCLFLGTRFEETVGKEMEDAFEERNEKSGENVRL